MRSMNASVVVLTLIEARFAGVEARFDGIDKRLDGLHEDIREIGSDMKLLTGKVYELMAQKG